MQESHLQQQIIRLIEPLLHSLGLDLWGLEFLPAGRSILRIYIEKATPPDLCAEVLPDAEAPGASGPDRSCVDAGIDECSEASRLIGLTLEVEDPIPGPYVLEVSTPGLERRFFKAEQLVRYIGHALDLSLTDAPAAFPGRKKFTGVLASSRLEGERRLFTLKLLDGPEDEVPTLDFAWDELKKARLLFMEPEKQGGPAKKGQKKSAKAKK